MKTLKVYLLVFSLLIPFFALSQVGIGTVTPNAQLEIKSTNQSTPTNTDGIIIPKIDEFPSVNPTVSQDGMLVYVTGNGSESKGFYYWNHSSADWITIVGSQDSVTKVNELSDGKSDSDGSDNGSSIFLGINAGLNDDETDNSNVGIGKESLRNNTSGFGNSAIGSSSMLSNTSGTFNTSIGYGTLQLSNGSQNTALGNQVMRYNTSGIENVGVGSYTMTWSRTGNYNTAVGKWSFTRNEGGHGNTALGYFTGHYTKDGNFNTYVGYRAGGGTSDHSKSYSVFLGNEAGFNETNSHRLYIDNSSTSNPLIYGEFNTNILRINGTLQVGNPSGSGYTFPENRGASDQVLKTNASGIVSWVNVTSFGSEQIDDLSDGKTNSSSNSIYLGVNAGSVTSDANIGNVSIGQNTLSSLTSGGYNVAIGDLALEDITNGVSNVALGNYALTNKTSGNSNVALGSHAQFWNYTGTENSSIGLRSLYGNSGNYNTAIGAHAGHSSNSGSYNVFIGYNSGYNETGNNKLYIENTNANANNALIYGEFDTNLLRINGTLNISNNYSFPTIDGVANQVLQTNGSGVLSWVNNAGGVTASNGLNISASDIKLGGTLTEHTTFTHGNFNQIHNLSGTGDFIIQDNGTNHFEIRDNGSSYFGGATYWRQNNTSGTTVASIGNIGDDGLFSVNNGGTTQHFIYGAGTTAFNLQGIDTDFQISGDNSANLFYIDASTDRVGIGNNTPNSKLHITGGTDASLSDGTGYLVLGNNNGANIVVDENEIIARNNGANSTLFLNQTGGDVWAGGALVHSSDRRLKHEITSLEYGLSEILKLQPKQYFWKNRENQNQKSLGFIAQDVQGIIKNIVHENDDKQKTLSISYTELIPVLVNAIQEQQKQIEILKTDIASLKENTSTSLNK